MRTLLSLAAPFVLALFVCGSARAAQTLSPPHDVWASARLALDAPPTAHPETQLRPQESAPRAMANVSADDGRAFWYASGAAAATSLGARVVLGVPVFFAGVGLLGVATLAPIPALLAVVAIAVATSIIDSAAAAAVGTWVFNSTSKSYEADFLPAFLGHFAGDILGSFVSGLVFGMGGMLLYGLVSIVDFIGQNAIQSATLFTFLGAMPAVVLAGVAGVALPALVCAWALTATAHAKPGFRIAVPAPDAPSARAAAWTDPLSRARLPTFAFGVPAL
jgi:hypothetical protein